MMAVKKLKMKTGPRVLLIDIETKPILAYVWALFDQNVSLNQIANDWSILSFSAKWLDDPPSKIMYKDVSRAKNIDDDKAVLAAIWKLLDEADVVISQNGKSFDHKKINARLILNGFTPPSSFKHIDTLLLAKKHFGFTSNKLAYMTDKLCTKYKKLEHKEFAGFEMWSACMAGNPKAWRMMKKYNMYDVLSLEELYHKLIPWDSAVDFNLYHEGDTHTCKCGSHEFEKRGWHYTATGRFQRFRCFDCGAWSRSRVNTFSKEKRSSLRAST